MYHYFKNNIVIQKKMSLSTLFDLTHTKYPLSSINKCWLAKFVEVQCRPIHMDARKYDFVLAIILTGFYKIFPRKFGYKTWSTPQRICNTTLNDLIYLLLFKVYLYRVNQMFASFQYISKYICLSATEGALHNIHKSNVIYTCNI